MLFKPSETFPHKPGCCFSVAKSYSTLCDPMDYSIPGSSVLLSPGFCSDACHWISDSIYPSHPLSSLLLLPSIFPSIRSFPMCQLFPLGGQSIGASASASVLLMNIQGSFPVGLIGLISFKSRVLSRVFSNPQFESIISLELSLLYGPTLTSVHDYWKNHSFDYMNLCQQSNISSFEQCSLGLS